MMAYEVFEKAHENESSQMAREYFKQLGLDYSNIKLSDLYKLREFILEEIYPFLADKSYHMINELFVSRKIGAKFKGDKEILEEAYLTASGSYFNEREAISFNDDGFIGFCGWASGCNRIPFIKGFIKWCDWKVANGTK